MFKSCKRYFFLGVVFSLFAAFLDMINPKVVQYTVDCVLGTDGTLPDFVASLIEKTGGVSFLRSHLYLIALLVVVIALLAALFRYLYRMCNIFGTERLIKRLRDRLFDHIQRLPFSWYNANHTGDIIQRCTSDVETVRNFLSEQMTALFRIGLLIVMAMFFMIRIDGRLAFVSGVFIPVVILYSLFFHNRIGNAFQKADEEEGLLSAIAQENLTGVRVVRAFGREIYERERFEKQNDGYTRMWIRLMGWLSAFWCSNDFITGLQIMLVTVFGAVFCVHGELSVGAYIAFVSYNGMLAWPVRELGRVISDMSRVGVSVKRIRYILDSEPENAGDDKDSAPLSGDIVFDHVSFAYEKDTKVLEDVSFTLKQGQTLGILGGTGAGKSTLMYLLERLYELPEDCGRITIGGRDIRDIPLPVLRSHIGLVLQESFLFSRTLAENIAITQEGEPDMDAVKQAAGTADLTETIERFSDGYETFVGERGVTLSGGQKQSTAIAQLLVKNPPVMIFDDSLSAVDMETDARIRSALKERTADATMILISHRITTLMQADRILVLDHGHVAEIGSHEELLKKNGIYKHIYDIQVDQK
ncbi:MAG: ABC transporter ATP-binding protein/permease [Lachnospiraceae bacterium]|nr:ABC transporter ATP-binding protein/permease [Lachnospiraceae bacterium]